MRWGFSWRWVAVAAVFAVLALALKFGLRDAGLATLAEVATLAAVVLPVAAAMFTWARGRNPAVDQADSPKGRLSAYLVAFAHGRGLTRKDLHARLDEGKWDGDTIEAYLSGEKLPEKDFVTAFLDAVGVKNRWQREKVGGEIDDLLIAAGGGGPTTGTGTSTWATVAVAAIAVLCAVAFIWPRPDDHKGIHCPGSRGCKDPVSVVHHVYPPVSPEFKIAAPAAAKATTGAGVVTGASVAFVPGSDSQLVVADTNGNTYVWTVGSDSRTILPQPDGAGVDTVAFSSNGLMATGDSNHLTYLWPRTSGGYADYDPPFKDRGGLGVNSLAFGQAVHGPLLLAAGDQNGAVYLWTVKTGNHVDLINEAGDHVTSAAFSHNGTMLAAGDIDGSTYLWSLTGKPKIIEVLPDGGSEGVESVAFSRNDKQLAVGDKDGAIYLWTIGNLKRITHVDLVDQNSSGIDDVTFSPNGEFLVAGDHNGAVYVWTAAATEPKNIHTFAGPNGDEKVSVAFSSDGSRLAVSDAIGRIDIWNMSWLRSAGTQK